MIEKLNIATITEQEIVDTIFNCQFGDQYIDELSGEIVFEENDNGWVSHHEKFANALRNHYSSGWWRVVFDDNENEVHVLNVDEISKEA